MRNILCLAICLLFSTPAFALDPERREVVVVSGRIWDGYAYRETYLPSTATNLSLLDGRESAITFVRTQEYYWPLSRQVYVDMESQREQVDGVLRILEGDRLVAEIEPSPYSIVYPQGAVNGNASLVWGDEAGRTFLEYQEGERTFARRFAEAQRAQSAYERQLLAAAAARKRGEKVEPVVAPDPLPEPSLRLVTSPAPGYRLLLPAGDYTMELQVAGSLVSGTRRKLRVVATEGSRTLVADIVPEERWTRPIASNSPAARIFARAGSTFYVTLAEADRYEETEYLPVVSPQADPVDGRSMWVRRKSSDLESLSADWQGAGTGSLSRAKYKVEQTSGTGYGYNVRRASQEERADLEAFAVEVPNDPAVIRGDIRSEQAHVFRREVVVVHEREAGLSVGLAALPILAWGAVAIIRQRRSVRRSG